MTTESIKRNAGQKLSMVTQFKIYTIGDEKLT